MINGLLFSFLLTGVLAFSETLTVAKTTKWEWGGCNDPVGANVFRTTDPKANLYWEATGISGSDQFSYEWRRPDNTVYDSGSWDKGSGDLCYGSGLAIADHEPSTTTGKWVVRVFKNSATIFYLEFTITAPPGTEPTINPIPRIDKIEPDHTEAGVDTTFTVTGAEFQSGFSGRLRVNNAPSQWPIWPGAQTEWVSKSKVKLIVKVGQPGDPPSTFSLQVINPSPGDQPSNEYGGLRVGTSSTPPPANGSRWQYDSTPFYPSVLLEKSSVGPNKYVYRITVIGRSTVFSPGIWRCQLTMLYPHGVRSDRKGIEIATTASDTGQMLSGVASWNVLPRSTETAKGAAAANLVSSLLGLADPIAWLQIGAEITDFIAAGDRGPSQWFNSKLEQADDYHIVPVSYAAQRNSVTGNTGVMGVRFVLPNVDESSGNQPEFYIVVQTPGLDVYSFEIGTDRNALVRKRQ